LGLSAKVAGASRDDRFILLFHGEDVGLVKERARAAVARRNPDLSDPFSVVRLSGDLLASDPARLIDEVQTLSWGPGLRTIWVDAIGLQSLAGLESVAAEPAPSSQIVIEAGELRRDSSLLRICEQSECAALIHCAAIQPAAMEKLIRESFERRSLEIAPEAAKALASLLPPDWMSLQSELEKLAAYAHGRGRIEPADVAAVVAGSEVIGPEAVLSAALVGDFDDLARAWSRARAAGLDGGAIAGFALRRLFYRQSSAYRESGELTGPALRRAIDSLAAAIRDGRKEPRLADALALRSFWTLARDAKRRVGQR
jgi:DNA polymerase-3 subunit delta